MVLYQQPLAVRQLERKAEARRPSHGFTVADIRERVVTRRERQIAEEPHPALADLDLRIRAVGEAREVVADLGGRIAERR